MIKRPVLLIPAMMFFLVLSTLNASAYESDFRVGTGIYDITGPSAEVVFMGFAMMEQKGEGIHMRLWSRAFIAEDHAGNRAVLVSADVGWISQAVKQGVIRKLEDHFGGIYNTKNVLIQAQHTHSAPGGFTHYFTYNVPTLGFIEQNYTAVVDGIYKSVVRADANLAPGKIVINSDNLDNCGMNRSEDAYDANSDAGDYQNKTDTLMTLLKFIRINDDGTETSIGTLNWFPVHSTNMGVFNRLVSGDNKGYASYLFEKAMGTDYRSEATFVAAFAQSNSGDVSPNMQFTGPTPDPEGNDDIDHTYTIGDIQYQKAKTLFETAETRVTGNIRVAHEHVLFSDLYVEAADCFTCKAALGSSFAAGSTEDGFSPAPIWPEGFTTNDINYSDDFAKAFLADLLPTVFPILWPELDDDFKACHEPKPVLFPNGIMTFEKDDQGTDIPALPEVLPMQIIQIGDLVIIAPPAEITTMAGRRLISTVADIMGPENRYVVAALSNAYIGYVTTKEEYDMQHYEGGHNQFGPYSLMACQQEFGRLAESLVSGVPVPDGPEPRDIADIQKTLHIGVIWDGKLLREEFGQIFDEDTNENYDAEPVYTPNQTVRVSFVGGHPNNNLMTQDTYLEVIRIDSMKQVCTTKRFLFFKTTECEDVPDDITVVARDNDPETKFIWVRHHTDRSRIDIEWTIPDTILPGQYMITHYGHWKDGNPFSSTFGQSVPYEGSSRIFTVTR